MSRLGKRPVQLPDGVDAQIEGKKVRIVGKKGEKTLVLDQSFSVNLIDGALQVIPESQNMDREERAKFGLYRALIQNTVQGLSTGFQKVLVLKGIGYRVQKKGASLSFSLGYSHPVDFDAPNGIEFKVEGQNKIVLESSDKELLGQTCAEIIGLRKRDDYKGKGIYFEGENISLKPGKSLKK